MTKILNMFIVACLTFMVYIIFTGSSSVYDLVTGSIVALIVGALFSNITLSNALKVLEPRRWYYLLRYAIRYFIIDETLAHVDVIKRILNPRMPVNPAIVKVPYNVETDYAKTCIACSITNTPGTVVVEIDENEKSFYIHWIDAKTLEPEKAREYISMVFEKYSRKIFD
ncbi:MAG: Na+/H+ antiporter subunit E [Desulfurococcaceae archaeon]